MSDQNQDTDEPKKDEYGDEVFFEGSTVRFVICSESNVTEVLESDDVQEKVYTGAKVVCRMVETWKGAFKDQRKWKNMGSALIAGHGNVNLASLKKDQLRIGCVVRPGYRYAMVYATIKKGDDWPVGEITQFENAAKKYLDKIATKGKRKAE